MTDDDEQLARQALGLVELLALSHDDSEQRIVSLCRRAVTPVGLVAAVCVTPKYVCLARTTLDRVQAREVRVVAQVNFPSGRACIETTAAEVRAALLSGADEIDVVYPFRALLSGNTRIGAQMLEACKGECGARTSLTVTLETGELRDPQLIRSACRSAIASGVNFLKSCTDRLVTPVSPQAARIMLECIAEVGGQVGFKAAGGIRTLNDARPLMTLAGRRFGPLWLSEQRVRLGASVLLEDLLMQLGVLEPALQAQDGY